MTDGEQDEHQWEMKGVGHGGGSNRTIVGFQCMNCGKAKIEQFGLSKSGVIYDGYPEPSKQTDSDN
ncbi:hypothetical protein HYG81_25835 (plasmid) [Natrinema zhouii]|uniref:hypothetical protein n=1 Tax=Natrinema zhouii TaxID=1710539 RepID=UPI001CFFF25C|nr:hypothetical protein [Natrinema zhouii]UHQ99260.1 hypothetical protein HYG81_25835 [Natrinema zhouii]